MRLIENSTGAPLFTHLDLSTLHVLGPDPDFGELRVATHDHGWVVFVCAESEVPEWLQPIIDVALTEDQILINFDNGAEVCEAFAVYE